MARRVALRVQKKNYTGYYVWREFYRGGKRVAFYVIELFLGEPEDSAHIYSGYIRRVEPDTDSILVRKSDFTMYGPHAVLGFLMRYFPRDYAEIILKYLMKDFGL